MSLEEAARSARDGAPSVDKTDKIRPPAADPWHG
jgi:hypothetical protein